jgi:hypothetical protein
MPHSTATPGTLRQQADRARFLAHALGDDEAAMRLRTYAAELEARAEALTALGLPTTAAPRRPRFREDDERVGHDARGRAMSPDLDLHKRSPGPGAGAKLEETP